ncbi:MAG: Bcr/CflA family multidrug efflux MFS transporter [Kouleothrix sp.]|nr:Bcr/CflA family multidrug efflux MFS transporter [Kouleothrix sp.]
MPSTSRRPSTARLTLILGALTAFGPMSIDMYLPSLPAIAREFHTDTATAQISLAIFFAGLAAGQAFYGPIADRYGRKRPLLIGCALYAVASIACALAPSIEALIALRLVQAIGGCAGMVLARSAVRDLFDEHDSARMYSFLMLVMGLAPVTAPLIGGQLLVAFSWRAIFWVLSGFGLLCLLMVLLGLPETLPAERRSRAGLGLALGVYGRLLADPRFIGYALTGGFVSAGMFAYISGSPFVFIELYGVAPTSYGWLFGTNALGLVIASQINRRLLARYRGDEILAATLAVSATSGLVLVLAAATGFGGLAGLMAPLFVCVASGGLVGPNTAAAAMAPHGRVAGSASALLGTLQFVVGALAGALVGVLANGTGLPMAGVIAACEIAALLIFRALAARPVLRAARG